MKSVVSTLRVVRAAVVITAAQVPKRRVAALAGVAVILVALVWFVPLPSALQLRDWAASLGPWFPLAFLAAHVVVTVFPFPRTAFTLAAGLLFGPLLGVALALVASTLSAVIALLLVRAAGWQVGNVDATVMAQAPRLAPHVPAMRQRIAHAVGVALDQVSVKAKTAEGLGPVGKGESMEARAVCLLWRG